MNDVQSHNTTFKVKAGIGNGIRLMAAVNGTSVADLAEEAVARILEYHSRPVRRLPEKKARVGRPGASIEQAAAAIMRSRPGRNEALPTRLAPEAAEELDRLADELGTQMNHLAEQGALHLLRKGPRIARALAGLDGEGAEKEAYATVGELATGKITVDTFAETAGLPKNAKAVLRARHLARAK